MRYLLKFWYLLGTLEGCCEDLRFHMPGQAEVHGVPFALKVREPVMLISSR